MDELNLDSLSLECVQDVNVTFPVQNEVQTCTICGNSQCDLNSDSECFKFRKAKLQLFQDFKIPKLDRSKFVCLKLIFDGSTMFVLVKPGIELFQDSYFISFEQLMEIFSTVFFCKQCFDGGETGLIVQRGYLNHSLGITVYDRRSGRTKVIPFAQEMNIIEVYDGYKFELVELKDMNGQRITIVK
jgi:hypothetical protein